MKLLILAAVAASVALSGCAAFKNATPEDLGKLVDHLAAAGCSGTLVIDVGAATGQLGGGAHATNLFNGACDPSKAKPVPPTQ